MHGIYQFLNNTLNSDEKNLLFGLILGNFFFLIYEKRKRMYRNWKEFENSICSHHSSTMETTT